MALEFQWQYFVPAGAIILIIILYNFFKAKKAEYKPHLLDLNEEKLIEIYRKRTPNLTEDYAVDLYSYDILVLTVLKEIRTDLKSLLNVMINISQNVEEKDKK
jgi:hypothetical protein